MLQLLFLAEIRMGLTKPRRSDFDLALRSEYLGNFEFPIRLMLEFYDIFVFFHSLVGIIEIIENNLLNARYNLLTFF